MKWFRGLFSESPSKSSPPSENEDVKSADSDKPIEDADEVLPEDNRSLIRQLLATPGISLGMDLSKITFPTFVLEPRSLLEKLSDAVLHPELFEQIPRAATPLDRLIAIVTWNLSGCHRRPRGAKKPFNPILGETFRATVLPASGPAKAPPAPNGSQAVPTLDEIFGTAPVPDATSVPPPAASDPPGSALWVSEQVSHHPPVSAFYSYDARRSIIMQGYFAPKSKFYGNSVASVPRGGYQLYLPEHNELYALTWPTVYCKGILFGTLRIELGGHVYIRSATSDFHADIEFHTKGIFTGKLDAVTGTIFKCKNPSDSKCPRDVLYSIDGNWKSQIFIRNGKDKEGGALLFDFNTNPMGTCVAPQHNEINDPTNSRVVWHETAEAVAVNDQAAATQSKTAVEEKERALRAERAAKNPPEVWQPKLFRFSMDPKSNEVGECEYVEAPVARFPTNHE